MLQHWSAGQTGGHGQVIPKQQRREQAMKKGMELGGSHGQLSELWQQIKVDGRRISKSYVLDTPKTEK